LITREAANGIALSRDGNRIGDPGDIGRAVRNKTGLTDIQILFDPIDNGDPEQIRDTVETLINKEPDGTSPDAWLSELTEWTDEHSVLVKRVFRGVSREFGDGASLDELETALRPALDGESLKKDEFVFDEIEQQTERFDRARELFQSSEDSESLWERFSQRTIEMQRLYSSAGTTAEMQAVVGGNDVPDADQLRATIDKADAHRQTVVGEQYERITGESPPEGEPESVVSSLTTWLFAHDGSSKETADRVAVEFDGVTIDDLYRLFETAWNGGSLSEEDLVNPTVVQQAKQYKRARQLLEAADSETSLWSQLREASERLEEEYPNHPVTTDVSKMLSRSQPPSIGEVEQLLAEAENPFEVDERLEELASELQSEHPDHEITQEVVNAVEGTSPSSEERVGELIEDAEELLDSVDEQLRRIREHMDELPDSSVVVIEPLD